MVGLVLGRFLRQLKMGTNNSTEQFIFMGMRLVNVGMALFHSFVLVACRKDDLFERCFEPLEACLNALLPVEHVISKCTNKRFVSFLKGFCIVHLNKGHICFVWIKQKSVLSTTITIMRIIFHASAINP